MKPSSASVFILVLIWLVVLVAQDLKFLDELKVSGFVSTPVLQQDMDSPSRLPVPAFGAWRDEAPESPKIDYAQAFARARASRMGSMPAREESRDFEKYSFHYHSESEPSSSDFNSAESYSRSVRSPRRIFHFFVCGSRKNLQAVS
ncbi:hypothetical protein R1sor_021184 [Riccia sorocarpa]|uniref:Uncharacterized protein n=1 Tax=Riccia sorocarpa TaxID=122646 RepID=A0ABD3GGD3_9MARC